MKEKIKLFNKLNIIIFVSAIILILFFYTSFISINADKHLFKDLSIHKVKNVTIITSDEIIKNASLPMSIDTNKYFDIIINTSEYSPFVDHAIASFTPYANFYIYSNGIELYRHEVPSNSVIKSGGSKAYLADIPKNHVSPYITIRVVPLLKEIKRQKISNIYIGRKSDILLSYLLKDLPTILISLYLILNFIIALVFTIYNRTIFQSQNFTVIYLSLAGLCTGSYFLAQPWIINYIFSNISTTLYIMEYSAFLTLFIPSVKFIQYKISDKFKQPFNIMSIILIINAISQYILSILGIYEFKQMLPISHLLIYSSIVLIIVGIVSTELKKSSTEHIFIIPTTITIVSTITMIIHYKIYNNMVTDKFIILVALSLTALGINEIIQQYVYFKKKEQENHLYKTLAIIDSLTGIPNRTAYNNFIQDVQDNNISGWSLSMDINNLKYINDTFGHLIGDKQIINFANILMLLSRQNPNIKVFRMGGDEFFMFIKESINFNVQNVIDRIEFLYKNSDKPDSTFTPTFSAGYHYYDATSDNSFSNIYHMSDQDMYRNKQHYKQINKDLYYNTR